MTSTPSLVNILVGDKDKKRLFFSKDLPKNGKIALHSIAYESNFFNIEPDAYIIFYIYGIRATDRKTLLENTHPSSIFKLHIKESLYTSFLSFKFNIYSEIKKVRKLKNRKFILELIRRMDIVDGVLSFKPTIKRNDNDIHYRSLYVPHLFRDNSRFKNVEKITPLTYIMEADISIQKLLGISSHAGVGGQLRINQNGVDKDSLLSPMNMGNEPYFQFKCHNLNYHFWSGDILRDVPFRNNGSYVETFNHLEFRDLNLISSRYIDFDWPSHIRILYYIITLKF